MSKLKYGILALALLTGCGLPVVAVTGIIGAVAAGVSAAGYAYVDASPVPTPVPSPAGVASPVPSVTPDAAHK